MGVELKTVVIRVEAESDVSVPCRGVSHRLVDCVILLPFSDIGKVDEFFMELVRWFAPDRCLKCVLWLGYVDAMGKVSERRWGSRSSDHGGT